MTVGELINKLQELLSSGQIASETYICLETTRLYETEEVDVNYVNVKLWNKSTPYVLISY